MLRGRFKVIDLCGNSGTGVLFWYSLNALPAHGILRSAIQFVLCAAGFNDDARSSCRNRGSKSFLGATGIVRICSSHERLLWGLDAAPTSGVGRP